MKNKRPETRYVQIDKYVFDHSKPLGFGACGTVYLGFYIKDENTFVAIKEISVKANMDITDSLLREINVMRKLQHKNIVTFIDAKKNDEYMYLVTQYCNQGTIEDLVYQRQLSEEEVLAYLRQMAQGFKYIRTRKIVHRDIKPQNILLHDGVIKIADFGLAKAVDSATNKLQTFSGTPLFMSPQIIKQETYNELADIWSLGVTLYFMLFRQYPWSEVNPLKLLKKIEHKVANLIPDGAPIQDTTRDLLKRMLVVDENKRLTWEDFFAHPAVRIADDPQASLSCEIEDITQNQIVITSKPNSEQDEEIQELGRRLTMNHEKQQNSLVRARRARDQLEFERQCGVFFVNVAKELIAQKERKPDIPEDLYVKCLFLLNKRAYAIFLSLNQMLLFDSNSSGIISIQNEDWVELMNNKQLRIDLTKIRALINGDYEYAKKEFFKSKDLLYQAQISLTQFELIDRGDTYKDTSIEENENMIMAFNDNFLKLFFLLARDLEPTYLLALDQQVAISKSYIFTEKKIDYVFVYDIIIVLSFRNVVKRPPPDSSKPLINFYKYQEERKRVDPIEILHRIHQQRESWEKLA